MISRSETKLSLDALRREAKRLHRGVIAGEAWAQLRLRQHPPGAAIGAMRHADALHVVAQEHGFASWPRLKSAAEVMGLDRAARQQRLKVALFRGQVGMAEALLERDPDLAEGLFGLQCALYDRSAVEAALSRDPGLAVCWLGPRTPILHLAFSRWIHARPELEADMLAVAELLLAHGADVNDGIRAVPGRDHRLSALYGAIGHADNMVLARWLLARGANPDDGESLYHACELGHHEGLRMLLAAGAEPRGTNALLRAVDFHDHAAVEMLLAAGARADDFDSADVGGEAPAVLPALHQAARRGSDARMVGLLLEAGADPGRVHLGASAYGYARVLGSAEVASAVEARGAAVALSREEALLAGAAEGVDQRGARLDLSALPEAYLGLLHEVVRLPERLEQVQRLVALGVPSDKPDQMGLTPVQVAGWEGRAEIMSWLLSLGADLGHLNHFGGTLVSTILHGVAFAPGAPDRNHAACLCLALEAGVPVARHEIESVENEEMRAILEDWPDPGPVGAG